jgi:predicted permease
VCFLAAKTHSGVFLYADENVFTTSASKFDSRYVARFYMDAFLFAFGAVTPLILIVALGYLLKRLGLFEAELGKRVNKVVFKILIPMTVFLNIYKIEDVGDVDPTYIVYAAIVTSIVFLVSLPLSSLITNVPNRRGVISQMMYRSNYALIGLPLAELICGPDGLSAAALLSVVSVSLFNAFAVVSFSIFEEEDKRINFKKIFVDILKNPLIIAILAGLVCLLTRKLFGACDISFRLSQITPLFKAITYIANSATPVALLCLGAQFEFSAIRSMKKEIICGVLLRTVIVPTLALGIAYLFFDFTAGMFAAMIAAFATPVSVSSAPMAQEMGGDGELAGQLVLWSTAASSVTLFAFIYALRLLGAF